MRVFTNPLVIFLQWWLKALIIMIILTNFNLLVTFSNQKKLKLMALKMLKEFFKILNSAKQVIIFRHAILWG